MISKKIFLQFATILIFAFTLLSCQNTGHPEQETDSVNEAEHVTKLTPEKRLKNIRANLKEVKMELAKEGKYNCCIQPTCDWCALHEGECPCYDNLQAGKAVCPGCGLGWHNGNGVAEGVEASQVNWDITHEHAAGGHSH